MIVYSVSWIHEHVLVIDFYLWFSSLPLIIIPDYLLTIHNHPWSFLVPWLIIFDHVWLCAKFLDHSCVLEVFKLFSDSVKGHSSSCIDHGYYSMTLFSPSIINHAHVFVMNNLSWSLLVPWITNQDQIVVTNENIWSFLISCVLIHDYDMVLGNQPQFF